MSYVRKKKIKGHYYDYLVRSERHGKNVRQIHIQYLGVSGVVPNPSSVSKYVERQVGDSGVKPSKQEVLGTEFRFNIAKVNDVRVQMALGAEKEVERIRKALTRYWKQTDTTMTYDVVFTETSQGAGRILIVPTHAKSSYFGKDEEVEWAPSAGLVWRPIEGRRVVVDVMAEEEVRGMGLAAETMKAMQEKYGQLYVIGPYSQQGAKLVARFPEAIQLVERKSVVPNPNEQGAKRIHTRFI